MEKKARNPYPVIMVLRNQLKLKNHAIPATMANIFCAGNISFPTP